MVLGRRSDQRVVRTLIASVFFGWFYLASDWWSKCNQSVYGFLTFTVNALLKPGVLGYQECRFDVKESEFFLLSRK